MTKPVLYERRGRIAYITLNRPEVMNAIDAEVTQGLYDAWVQVRDDPSVWTAIVTGAGEKAFSAGADLRQMSERRVARDQGEPPGALRQEVTVLRGIDVWKPFIAAINGYCLAGGLELALACDIRVAAEHATFALAEVTRAIIPGGGGTQRLPRLVPLSVALEMLLTGDRVTASEAYRIGLVNRVVPLIDLLPTAEAIAAKINENGPLAVRAIKEVAYKGMSMTLEQGLCLERLFANSIHMTEDSREGPLAFVQKRKAIYEGR